MNATEILVIILSIFLAIFLLLGIILFGYMIALTRQIQRITKSAEKTVDNIESITTGLAKVISPMYVVGMFSDFLKKVKNKGGRNVKD